MADDPLAADTQPATSMLPSELAPGPAAARLPERVPSLRFAGPLEQEYQTFAHESLAAARRRALHWLPVVLLALAAVAVGLHDWQGGTLAGPVAWVGLPVLGLLTIFFPMGHSFVGRLETAVLFGMASAAALVFLVPGAAWPEQAVALLWLTAGLLTTALGAHQHDKTLRALFLMQQTVTQMASTDTLTGLSNRRAFELFVARTMQHAARGQQRVALLLVDADRFRPYTEQRGHAAGNVALKALARAVSMRIRRQFDLGARLGNEEFALFFYDVSLGFAWTAAEELRRDVEQRLAMAHAGSPAGVLTVSVGAAVSTPGESFEQLYQRAEFALVEAKAKGGNQMQLAE